MRNVRGITLRLAHPDVERSRWFPPIGCILAALLVAAGVALSLSVPPAGAVVARIGGRGYGVTPIKGVDASSMVGAYRSRRALRLSGPAGARNFDGAPLGGGPLEYLGGPVMHSANTHVIYWDRGEEFKATTKGIINGFFTNVAHDSGLASNVFAVAGQYSDTTGNAAYSSTFEGALADTHEYPTTGNCTVPNEVDKGPYAKCLFDSQLQTELSRFINEQSLPKGPTQLYFLLLPHSVATCLPELFKGKQVCSNNFFCAYHSYISPSTANEIIYADIPFSLLDTGFAKGCQDDGHPANLQQPNPDSEGGENKETRFADVALKYIGHEWVEATTDPLVNNKTAWVDKNELEIGDKCNGVSPDLEESGVGYDSNAFLPILGGSVGLNNLFNQSINSGSYYLQSEWDDGAKACTMKPLALSAAGFTPSPGSGTAGVPVTFTGTAVDAYGAPNFVWKWGDGTESAGATPTHVYAAPGSYEVTMTVKDQLTGSTTTPVSHTIVVNGQPTASFTIAPNPATPGIPVAFNGGGSIDPDGAITNYAWNFGDGSIGAGVLPSHTYVAPGNYTVTLMITDSAAVTGAISHVLTVAAAPTSTIASLITPNSTFSLGAASFNQTTGVITFTETMGDPGTFSWLLTFQNGKFGVFAASNHKCKVRFVRLRGKCRPSRIVFAKGSKAVAGAGSMTLKLKPSPSALKALKNALKQKKGLPVIATFTFQSARGGSPVSHTQSLTVKLKKK
jgi:PKD repeat protein